MSLTPLATDVVEHPVMPIQPLEGEVVVWHKPSCVQCVATERSLISKGIPHRMIDLTEHPDALEALRASNFLQAPVVQFGDDMWTGFRPDKLDAVLASIA